ncbi:hypothetical protein BTVI_37783 [Pitangus sulphuratus]|nr:hypothetical protein BTVI_37783 [Pitangus sulphuratus]
MVEEHCQQVDGGDPAPLLSSGEASPGALCPDIGALAQVKHGAPEVTPVDGYKDDEGLKHLSYEERLRVMGMFSLEMTERGPHQCLSVSAGRGQRLDQTLLRGAQQQDKRQWVGTDTQEVLPGYEEELFPVQ